MAKTTKTPASPIDQRPTCCECGSHNVETNAWIEYRDDGTLSVVNGDGPIGDETGNWCHDCGEHVHLDYPDTTPEDDDIRQKANVAREHGPELLKALKALVKAAERTGTLRTDSGALGRAIHLLTVTGDYQ